jgi:murein DD-endopeptidase MepM/ murein hydrolase activator NlpD
MLHTLLAMRRFLRYLLAAAISVAAVTAPLAARAGAQQSDADKVTKLYQQKEATDAELEAASAKLANLQKQRQQLDGSLTSLAGQVEAANARVAAAQAEADRFAALAAEVQAKVDETARELEKAQADMRKSALLLYTQHDVGTNMLTMVTSLDKTGAFVEGQHYLERVSSKRRRDAVRVNRLKTELETQKAQIAEQQKVADDARAAATTEKAQLDALVAQQEQSRAAAAANEQQTGTLVASIQAQHDKIDAEFTAASNAWTAQLRSSPDTTPGPSGFLRPVSGPVTSPFGTRTDPITGVTAVHSGIDLGAPCGTPIKAAAFGTVFQVVPVAASGGYGNMTIIKHGGNIATLYGHQSSIIVSPGQVVAIGQVIGYVGSTGKSTGCHLHWEVRVNGAPVNPAAYL